MASGGADETPSPGTREKTLGSLASGALLKVAHPTKKAIFDDLKGQVQSIRRIPQRISLAGET
jgi:hypothetical protein